MKLPTTWPPLVKLMAHLEAMGERDRIALLLAGLALAGAAEWFLVWPMHHQRGNIVEAARAEAQGVTDAAQHAEQARAQARAALGVRTQALDQELAELGMAQSNGQQISALLARALRPQAVQVVALRELGVEEIEMPPAVAIAAGVDGVAAAPAPAVAAPLLYRHRFELRLAGEVPALLAALAALEQEVRPLRTERVRMAPGEGHAVQLTLALVVLGTDRVWLSL